jgi:uncharacterized coiled-coil protein SlyX
MKKLKDLRTQVEEAVQFKVDVEGLPPTFMTGKSPTEILAKLRKIVKQPSLIKNVERYTDMEVKRAYRNKAQGRDIEEANDPPSRDEKSMAMKQAEFIEYVADELGEYLKKNKDFPEWMQNKLSELHQKAKDMHSTMGAHGPEEDDEDEKKVNETSLELRGRYATKAKSDYKHQKFSADIAKDMNAPDAEKYYRRKQSNRLAGIRRALKK